MEETILQENNIAVEEPKTLWKIVDDNTNQKELFLSKAQEKERRLKKEQSSTFLNNLSIPIHRWFRFSAGFSAEWVRKLLIEEYKDGRRNVIDPFAGSGTVLLEAEYCDFESVGIDSHPFISKVGQTKLYWKTDFKKFIRAGLQVLDKAKSLEPDLDEPPKLIKKCFYKGYYKRLKCILKAIELSHFNHEINSLLWLSAISIIRECSSAGTAQWQYVLPDKEKKNVSEPNLAFKEKVLLMASDMKERQKYNIGASSKYIEGDARKMKGIEDNWADLVITSPPYANNYDYADAVRLELTVLGEIERWRDLHEVIRKYLLPSCTQHVTRVRDQTFEIANDPILSPIKDELIEVVQKLSNERKKRKGKKDYHAMAASYFRDMAKVWKSLRAKTKDGAKICFVVGDSAPYGIYLPVDRWFGELALAYGFKSFEFEKTRDRNTKWKNRKHTVPLKEGRLWVNG
jgi:DNA modification methylase